MRIRITALLLGALVGCSSFEDYVYPAPEIETAPTAIELAPDGVALPYDGEFDPLPVVEVALQGRPARALIATRRNQHSIAPDAVPEGAVPAGEATVPERVDGGVRPTVRQVVRVAQLTAGDALLEGLLMLVEPLPAGIDVALSPSAFPGAVVTLDGPARVLRVRPGELPAPKERDSETVRLVQPFLMGECAASSSRFMASIVAVAASELDGPVMVGPSTSRSIDTREGPELLPSGPGALDPYVSGAREVRMDDIFGRDRPRAEALEVDGLGSGWLVLGARYLASHVFELDPQRGYARLR